MSECDEWEGPIHPDTGYGLFYAGRVDGKDITIGAHRFVMMQEVGHLERWDFVLHSCDNRKCVNIEHLSVGTIQDNVADMYAKGRGYRQKKTTCPRGHLYDYVAPGTGHRRCIRCDKKNQKLRKKAAE